MDARQYARPKNREALRHGRPCHLRGIAWIGAQAAMPSACKSKKFGDLPKQSGNTRVNRRLAIFLRDLICN
jgi:hypothetical protein